MAFMQIMSISRPYIIQTVYHIVAENLSYNPMPKFVKKIREISNGNK